MVWKQSLRDKSGHNNWTDGLDAPVKKPSAAIREMFPHADAYRAVKRLLTPADRAAITAYLDHEGS